MDRIEHLQQHEDGACRRQWTVRESPCAVRRPPAAPIRMGNTAGSVPRSSSGGPPGGGQAGVQLPHTTYWVEERGKQNSTHCAR
jgi:hypothetical protein